MNAQLQHDLDERFADARGFLATRGQDLVDTMVETFQPHLWDCLDAQSSLQVGDRMTVPRQPDLSGLLADQLSYTWCLGYAVGAAGVVIERK